MAEKDEKTEEGEQKPKDSILKKLGRGIGGIIFHSKRFGKATREKVVDPINRFPGKAYDATIGKVQAAAEKIKMASNKELLIKNTASNKERFIKKGKTEEEAEKISEKIAERQIRLEKEKAEASEAKAEASEEAINPQRSKHMFTARLLGPKAPLILSIAIANFLIDWIIFGFDINSATFFIDLLTAGAFLLIAYTQDNKLIQINEQLREKGEEQVTRIADGKFYKYILMFLLLELFTPLIPFSSGYLSFIPWWVVFVVMFEGAHHTLVGNIYGQITILIIIVLVILPYYQTISSIVTFDAQDRAEEFTKVIKFQAGKSWDAVGEGFSDWWCDLPYAERISATCQQKKIEEKLGPVRIYIDTKIPPKIAVEIGKFKEEMPLSENIDQFVRAASNLDNDVTIELSCGIEGVGLAGDTPGKIMPSKKQTIILKPGTRIDEPVKCNFPKDEWFLSGVRDMYFKAEIKNIESTSKKSIFIMDKTSKDSIIGDYLLSKQKLTFNSIKEENDFMRKNYGEYFEYALKGGKILTETSDEFIIIPLREGSSVTSTRDTPRYVQGVNAKYTIPFKVYLQKNKKGDVININSIKIKPQSGLSLDRANCNYDNTTDWTKELKATGEQNQYGLPSCTLSVVGDAPVLPTLREVEVTVNYNFLLTAKTSVRVVKT